MSKTLSLQVDAIVREQIDEIESFMRSQNMKGLKGKSPSVAYALERFVAYVEDGGNFDPKAFEPRINDYMNNALIKRDRSWLTLSVKQDMDDNLKKAGELMLLHKDVTLVDRNISKSPFNQTLVIAIVLQWLVDNVIAIEQA